MRSGNKICAETALAIRIAPNDGGATALALSDAVNAVTHICRTGKYSTRKLNGSKMVAANGEQAGRQAGSVVETHNADG